MAISCFYPAFQHWTESGTTYIYSDPHFSDLDLIAGVSGRPNDIEQLKLINSKVGRADTIIILGDIGNIDFVKKIRAKYKILICGNHDLGASNYQRVKVEKDFDADKYTRQQALTEMELLYPGYTCQIEKVYRLNMPNKRWKVYADNHLFDEVYMGPVMVGPKLILSHEPINGITLAHNIHGHVHNKQAKDDMYHTNVCSDVINYIPLSLNKWVKEGHLKLVQDIHRQCVDKAVEAVSKRGYSLKGKGRAE